MKEEKVKQFLLAIGSKATGKRADWVLARCPLFWRHGGKDHNPSFAITASAKKKSKCKCMSCGFGGDLLDLMRELFFYSKKYGVPVTWSLSLAAQMATAEFEDMELTAADIPDYEEVVEKTEVQFPEDWLTSFKKINVFPEAMEYCASRMVGEAVLDYLDVRFDPIQRRVCFPYRDAKGRLMGVQGRSIEKDPQLRYYQYGYKGHRNSHVWMGEDKLELDEPVVLVEGPFDMASILRVYHNVAASFTSGLSFTKVRRISDATEIVTFYDHGAGGDAARAAIDKMVKGTPITHLIPEEHEGDAGNMSLQAVASYLQPHVEIYLE